MLAVHFMQSLMFFLALLPTVLYDFAVGTKECVLQVVFRQFRMANGALVVILLLNIEQTQIIDGESRVMPASAGEHNVKS